MPNLPFGLLRTTTHVSRMSRIGFAAEAIVTQRQFRQGIGRLIRREGLLHRRVWLLDGRLQHPSAVSYMMDFRRVLMPYIHREPFDV
jgi:ATP-dependent DNA helicase DinG